MPNLHLTDLSVRALKPSDKYISYWDDTTPAFGIRVGKRTKTWTVMRGRERERITIGKYPELSLAEARAEAKKVISATPETKAAAITFAAAREQFLEEHYRDKAEQTKYNVSKSLRRHFKSIEHQQLTEIEDSDLERCLAKIADTPSEQLHAFRYVRCFLRWCVRPPRRYLKHSPMEGYEPPGTDRKGTRILSDDELVAVWSACQEPRHAILRVMMLWGTRNTETRVLERVWRLGGVLTIPGEHTKNGRDHAIPVCPLAEHVLTGSQGSNEYYFAGRWGHGHLSARGLAKIAEEVKEASGTSGWQIRDLRRTFRSNMARFKVPRDVCEVLINHAPPVLDEIYDRYDRIEEKRAALAKYEAALLWLLVRT